MNDLFVFNHHSLPFSHRGDVETHVPGFLKTCVKGRSIGFHSILVDDTIDTNWFRVELSPGYFWQDWYNEHNNSENIDLIRAFRTIQVNQPLFSEDDISDNVELYEVEYENSIEYSALKAASWNDSPLCSFPSNELWNKDLLPVTVRTLDADGEMEEGEEELLNFYSMEALLDHKSRLLEERNQRINNGVDLFNDWRELFPNIESCGKVREQLSHWSASGTLLSQVIESLTVLNRFTEKWQEGEVSHYSTDVLQQIGLNHRVSGESQSVSNNPALRMQREFWLPIGVKAYFEHHIKLSMGYRIHFYPDSETKKLYVGYIGPHLKLR